MKRIGIYAGTFDPIHAGHIAFALQALEAADLDEVYFMPERKPRYKSGVEHFGHRVAMVKAALKPHPKFQLIDLPDVSFTVSKTLPALIHLFPDAQLVFLFGSDVVANLGDWQHIGNLFAVSELVIGMRDAQTEQLIKASIESWDVQPRAVTLFPSFSPSISSSDIRQALLAQQTAKGLLRSVQRYSNRHWLYVSVR